MHLAVVDENVLSQKSYDVEAVKNVGTHTTDAHPGQQEVAIEEAEWTTLIQVIKEHLNDMDCIMIQQMTERKKGETVNFAAIVIEERVNKMQGWQEKEER